MDEEETKENIDDLSRSFQSSSDRKSGSPPS